MICKELDPFVGGDERATAGRKAEEQLAFYLRRAFERDDNVRVFNSLRFEDKDDAAQMDHLILHSLGVIIVESKSVTGQVAINEHGEWTRQSGGRRVGIPSPVLQAERQGKFLRHLLQDNVEQLLSKILGFRKQFGSLRTDVLVAISDSGIIERPHSLELPEVCKADQVPERIRAILKRLRGANSILSLSFKDLALDLGVGEIERISEFFLSRHRPLRGAIPTPTPPPASAVATSAPTPLPTRETCQCRACGSNQLAIQYAHSYYFKCLACGGNTPAKATCETCGKPARLRKSGLQFDAECGACGERRHFYTNPVNGGA